MMLHISASSLKDVKKRTENVDTQVDPSGWRPYYTFLDSLNEKYARNEGFQGTHICFSKSYYSLLCVAGRS